MATSSKTRPRQSGSPIYPGELPEHGTACELCGREVERVTRHHLRPRSEGGTETALLCPACHRQVHALYTNKTLAREMDHLDALRSAPEMAAYLAWIRKQADRKIPVRKSRDRR